MGAKSNARKYVNICTWTSSGNLVNVIVSADGKHFDIDLGSLIVKLEIGRTGKQNV
jgi:hypothetical protein